MLGVIWPDVRAEFDQSLGTLGIVSLIYGVARMSSATSGRPFVDRVGTGRAFILSLGVLAAVCGLLAGAPSWPIFLVSIAAVGFISGLLDSIGAVFIATLGEVGSAGLIHGMYGFGATVGPLLVAVLPGWRWPILATVGTGLVALTFSTVVRDRWPVVTKPDDTGPVTTDEPGPRRSVIIVSLVLFAAFVAVEVTAGQWIYTYLTDARSLADGPAAVAVSAFWAGLMIGRLLMAGRFIAGIIHRLGLGAFAVAAAGGILMVTVIPSDLALLPLALAGVALAPIVPTLFATTTARVGGRRSAQISGWQLVATNLGAISIPTLTGSLVDASGPGVIIVVITLTLAAIGLPLLVTLDRLTTRS